MRNRFVFFVGMMFLANSGCMYHGNNPYGYNGYYGSGSLPPQQPWTGGFPAGQPMNQPFYPPAGSSPTPLGTPYVPNGTQPSGSPSDWQPPSTYGAPSGGGGNSAPPFNPQTPGGGGTGVPDPIDDPASNNRSPGAQAPGGLTPTATSRVSEDVISPFSQEDSSRLPRNFQNNDVSQSDDPFEAPVRQTGGSGGGGVQQANRTTLSSPVSPKAYGHDPQFQWIKGVVEYDELNHYWVIMYDQNPQPSDPNGGFLTLAKHPSLDNLRDEDKVFIDGSLDETVTDARGIPVFRVTRLKKQK